MSRPGHENINFFFGTEVEHTPARGMYTMFVVGVQDINEIASKLGSGKATVEHIYFGANQSFPKCNVDEVNIWRPWEDMIMPFLKGGYLCTLDIDNSCAEGLCESDLPEYNNFIPMISVKLPYIQLLGYNATLKIDDKDFAATNPGVWCHSLHTLRDRKVFTNWAEYIKDEIAK
jgi:hypothetical protein